MAKLPIYEVQSRPQGGQVSPEAMGAGIGQAVADMGATLTDIGVATQRRQEVIDRVQLLNSFDQTAVTDLEAVQADGSIASKDTVDKYSSALRQRMDQVLNQHKGSSASRAELRAQLENQAGQYTKTAMGAQIKAQYTMIGEAADNAANKYAITAGLAPDQMTNAFAAFDADLGKLQGAVSKDQMDQFRKIGRSRIADGAIRGLLQRGNFTEAEKLLKDPAIGGMLNSDTTRQLTMDVAVDKYKSEKQVKEQEQNVAQWTSVLKRNLTLEEQMRVRMLPQKKAEYTLADKITELELVQGKPATSAQVTDLMGMQGTTGMFGNSLQGMALNFVTTNATAYANGMLSPEQARQFEASYNEAYKPIEKQDPQTGLWTRIAPAIPAFAQQASQRGARFYNSLGAPAPQTNQMPAVTGAVTSPAPQPAAQPTAQPAAGGQPAPAAPAQPGAATAPAPGGQSIWSRRGNISGVVPSAMQAVGQVPFIGEAMGGGGQYATDRQYADAMGRRLISALSESGRYGQAEMKSIEQEVSIAGTAFDNPVAYGQRLIGIDEALAKRVADAQKDLADPNISIEKRRGANDVIATITNFRQTLGVPKRVKSVEEARKLPPGSEFIDPNGVVRVVPGR